METEPTKARELAALPMRGFTLTPTTFDEAWRMAQILAKTEFAPLAFRGKPDAILGALAMGAEVGLSPMQALQSITIINGHASLWGDGQLAVVRRDPSVIKVDEFLDDKTMKATCVLKRKNASGEEEITTRSFSVEDAKTAGLWNKPGTWQSYPKRMLQMRARSFALRDGAADLLRGFAQAEEMLDVEPKNVTPIREITFTGPAPEEIKVLIDTPEEAIDEITELKTKLKWTDARFEVEFKTVAGDAGKLLEKMRAELERSNGKKGKAPDVGAAPLRVVPAPEKSEQQALDEMAEEGAKILAQEPQPVAAMLQAVQAVQAAPAPPKMSPGTQKSLFAALAALGISSKATRLAFAADQGIRVTSYSQVTEEQGRELLRAVALELAGPVTEPLVQGNEPCPACEVEPGRPHFAKCPEAVQGTLL